MNLQKRNEILLWTAILSVSLGYLEAAVVVYLRELYYPQGFRFPISTMDPSIIMVEIFREVSTLLIFISIGILAGKNRYEKFAYFLYAFAIWDIFYYVFLKLSLGWPDSLLTWDLLFLIPTVWTGPILGPIIVSIAMIALALRIIYPKSEGDFYISRFSFLLITGGAFIIFFTFIADFTSYQLKYHTLIEVLNPFNRNLWDSLLNIYTPTYFNWWIFSVGIILIFLGIHKISSGKSNTSF